jgi:hypothetical protein
MASVEAGEQGGRGEGKWKGESERDKIMGKSERIEKKRRGEEEVGKGGEGVRVRESRRYGESEREIGI